MTGIHPEMGPASGGTKITIFGQNLNIGSERGVTLTHNGFMQSCRLLPR